MLPLLRSLRLLSTAPSKPKSSFFSTVVTGAMSDSEKNPKTTAIAKEAGMDPDRGGDAEPPLLQPSMKVNGRFTNPWEGWETRGLKDVVQWKWYHANQNGIPGQAALEKSLPLIKTDLAQLANPPQDRLQVTWVGHATVLVQMDGMNILTDPVFADRCSPFSFVGTKRLRPPPFAIKDLPNIDVVVISHNHYDHLSHSDVMQLGNKPMWFVPLGLKKWMNDSGITNVRELDWWGEHPMQVGGKDFTVTCVPAQHWSKRTLTDDNMSLWSGWAVAGPKHRFYFAGDTGYCPVFEQIGKKCGPFDLAALPIGAYEPNWFMKPQHVNPEEAVLVHKDVRAKKSIGIHWATFMLSDEHYLEPPARLKKALESHNLSEQDFFVTALGEIAIV